MRNGTLLAQPRQVKLLGALVAAVCAVAVYLLAMNLTGSPQQAASAGARPASATPVAAKTFSRLPQRCALLSAAIVTKYLPGTSCNSHAYENPGGADSRALWTTPATAAASGNGDYFTDDVEVMLEQPGVMKTLFDSAKSEDTVASGGAVIHDSRPVAGLGTEAYMVFETFRGSSKTLLEVEDENALISINFDAAAIGLTAHNAEVPQSQAEQATLAMARDIMKKLH